MLSMIVFALSFASTALSEDFIRDKTYIHTLPDGVTRVTCNKCPPGTYLTDHCSVDGGDPVCTQCEEGKYNDVFSVATSCSRCGTQCSYKDREIMVKNCTTTSNISCMCREGFYRQGGSGPDRLCLNIDTCPAGQGVKVPAGNGSNTVCEPCQTGYTFSANESKLEKCMPCQTCAEDEEVVKLCEPSSDTECGPRPMDMGISTGAVVGIVLGVIAALVCGAIVFIYFKRRTRRENDAENGITAKSRTPDGPTGAVPMREPLLSSPNGHTQDGNVQNGPTQDGNVQNGHTQDGNVQNGPTQDGHAQDGHTQNGHVQNGQAVPPQTAVGESASHGHNADKGWHTVFSKLREDLVCQDAKQFFRLLLANQHFHFIEEIFIDVKGIKEKVYQLLWKWRRLEQNDATMNKLAEALNDWGRPDLADKCVRLAKELNIPCSWSRSSSGD